VQWTLAQRYHHISFMQVAQLAGYVAEHAAYHHGEQSLCSTIVNLAQVRNLPAVQCQKQHFAGSANCATTGCFIAWCPSSHCSMGVMECHTRTSIAGLLWLQQHQPAGAQWTVWHPCKRELELHAQSRWLLVFVSMQAVHQG
jgi:hypothetical protein